MRDLSIELQFTQIYKDHLHDDRAIREAYCLQFLNDRFRMIYTTAYGAIQGIRRRTGN